MSESRRAPRLDDSLARAIDQHCTAVEDAYSGYRELRDLCPVAYSSRNGGYFLLSRHRDVRKAALDWRTFSSAQGVSLPNDSKRPRFKALEQDPPDHGNWRKRYSDAISFATLTAIEPEIVRIADELIDSFAGRGTCDLTREFAESLPVLGICAALGLEDGKPEEIRKLALAMTASMGNPAEQGAALGGLAEYILRELHARRKQPRQDYLTAIAKMEVEGRLLSDQELAVFMTGFLVAGHETTTSALAGLLFHVLREPELGHRLLGNDEEMAQAIEEAVRIVSPFHGFSRTTTRPAEVEGIEIPAGETVRLCWAAANRDPTVFPDPDSFRTDRERNPHLGFGAGRHVCAGAPFARLEMRVGLRRLLTRLPDIALAGDQLDWHFVGGIMTIPGAIEARFTPRPTGI